jgi:hypothetical protein
MLTFKDETNTVRTNLKWTAPTENTDGTAIDYALTYRLYIDDVVAMTFPGTLNGDGVYYFPLADVGAITEPGSYTFELTAFPEGVDLDQEPERESAKSNAVVVQAILAIVPKGPTDLSTE